MRTFGERNTRFPLCATEQQLVDSGEYDLGSGQWPEKRFPLLELAERKLRDRLNHYHIERNKIHQELAQIEHVRLVLKRAVRGGRA